MPILAIFTGPTITKEQYDVIVREVGWKQNQPKGGILHLCAFDTQGGLRVADVWESADDLNDFVGTRLMPAIQKHGFAPPTGEVYPLHNADAFPQVSAFLVEGSAPKAKAKAKAKPKGKKKKK